MENEILKDPVIWFFIGMICGNWLRHINGIIEERKS